MGTRHMVGVIIDGKYKVGQYGQWDGYIAGQGATVLSFLRECDLKVFRNKLDNVFYATNEEIRSYYVEAGDRPDNKSGFIPWEVSDNMKKLYPSLHRDTGAQILNIIYESTKKIPLVDSSDFIDDDTFCEFAYVIDLDKDYLLCYCWGKNLFATYELSDLPTLEQMETDYETYCKAKNL